MGIAHPIGGHDFGGDALHADLNCTFHVLFPAWCVQPGQHAVAPSTSSSSMTQSASALHAMSIFGIGALAAPDALDAPDALAALGVLDALGVLEGVLEGVSSCVHASKTTDATATPTAKMERMPLAISRRPLERARRVRHAEIVNDARLLACGFSIRESRAHAADVSSPQPLAERFAVLGASLYAIAIVVEAIRSRAWIAAGLFGIIAAAALWVAGGRARYRLDKHVLEVSFHFPAARTRTVRVATNDIVDFVALSGTVRVRTRDDREIELPRGTMRSQDEASALAAFLRARLASLREREAGYRNF